jgi:peptide/nickel transport system permease protein
MGRFIIRRTLYAIVTLFILSLTIFTVIRLTGDPVTVMAEPGAPAEDLDRIRAEWGLDRPLPVQYLSFLKNIASGDLGKSFNYGMPVSTLYFQRLPNSLELAFAATLISFAIGIPAGLISGTPLHLIMPAFALGWYFAAAHMRLTRSSMLEVLGSEYVKLARLKGLPQSLVIAKHAFKNALIPVLTLAGVNLVIMINAAVIIEVIFAWPGIGRLLYEGIFQRDFPLVQGVVMEAGIMIVVINLMIDILYAYIDPRIRLTK